MPFYKLLFDGSILKVYKGHFGANNFFSQSNFFYLFNKNFNDR